MKVENRLTKYAIQYLVCPKVDEDTKSFKGLIDVKLKKRPYKDGINKRRGLRVAKEEPR